MANPNNQAEMALDDNNSITTLLSTNYNITPSSDMRALTQPQLLQMSGSRRTKANGHPPFENDIQSPTQHENIPNHINYAAQSNYHENTHIGNPLPEENQNMYYYLSMTIPSSKEFI